MQRNVDINPTFELESKCCLQRGNTISFKTEGIRRITRYSCGDKAPRILTEEAGATVTSFPEYQFKIEIVRLYGVDRSG